VIQAGQLREQIVSGVSQDEFINRIRKVLGAAPILGSNSQASNAAPQEDTPESQIARETPVAPLPSIRQEPSAKAKGKQKATPPAPVPVVEEKKVESQKVQPPLSLQASGTAELGLGAGRGRRPRAVDMFADSDSD